MALRIEPSPSTQQTQATSALRSNQMSPQGLAEQPSTIQEEATPPSGFCGGFSSIATFFQSAALAVLEGISSIFSSFADCIRGGPKEVESDTAWELPAAIETPRITPQVENPQIAPSDSNPFLALGINSDEKRKIFQIIHTLGTTSPILLWPQQSRLEQLGLEIEHVHPFKFLEYILLHPTLRADLDAIRNSSLLWPRFLEGLSRKLNRERQGLDLLYPGFSSCLQIDPSFLLPFIRSGNWEQMAFFLIDVKMGRRQLPPPPPDRIHVVSQTPTNTVQEAPPALSAWQQIALTQEQQTMARELVHQHRIMSYYTASWGDRHLNSLWDRLDQSHPLALLHYLFTTPDVITELSQLWPYRLHRYYFTSELTKLLNRKTEQDYLPHIASFAEAVGKDINAITAQIHYRRWSDLIELLRTPSVE